MACSKPSSPTSPSPRAYKTAPAAKSIHHAWLGGLIEHVLSLCTLCKIVCPHYPHVDGDLVLTGAILHDIGKIEELSYDRGFGYTDIGQLIGHIQIGVALVDDKIRQLRDFPPKLKLLLAKRNASSTTPQPRPAPPRRLRPSRPPRRLRTLIPPPAASAPTPAPPCSPAVSTTRSRETSPCAAPVPRASFPRRWKSSA
ncbi:MAG: HDIG domain-containing protein [Bryobacterales bacterium]|nr:HDIG domain-containing protein [Bryobacterales bacterium]